MSLASLAQQKLFWMLFIALTAYSFHAHLCGFTLWFVVFLISLSRLVLYVFNNLNFIIFCFLHRKLIRSLILSPSCMLLDVKGFSSFNTVRKEGQTQKVSCLKNSWIFSTQERPITCVWTWPALRRVWKPLSKTWRHSRATWSSFTGSDWRMHPLKSG